MAVAERSPRISWEFDVGRIVSHVRERQERDRGTQRRSLNLDRARRRSVGVRGIYTSGPVGIAWRTAILVVTGIGNKAAPRTEGHLVGRFTGEAASSARWEAAGTGRELEPLRVRRAFPSKIQARLSVLRSRTVISTGDCTDTIYTIYRIYRRMNQSRIASLSTRACSGVPEISHASLSVRLARARARVRLTASRGKPACESCSPSQARMKLHARRNNVAKRRGRTALRHSNGNYA